jgi:molybdopterin/thiamine biosynthesis adenylyltransferase
MINSPRITLQGSQEKILHTLFGSHASGHERAAIVLFRRLYRPVQDLPDSDRYIALEVIPFEESWITESSPVHVRFDLKYLRDIFRRCKEDGLVFGFVHNHPTGFPDFSQTDEENEGTLLKALTNRNGMDIHFVAMIWANGKWIARVRYGMTPDIAVPVRHTLVLGSALTMYGYDESEVDDDGMQARQAAAFGQPFVDVLRSLRIGVVGGGGTGSPTVTLLGRAGVGELVVIDRDTLEKSNLNRVRGAGMRDVKRNKARILQDYISSLELPIKIAAIESLIDEDPYAIDALSSCDVIFGCTDDQIGREILNTALYVYAQAYIDVGLGGKVITDDDGHATLRYHYGRISMILPESGECLFCQDVIKPAWIAHQYALRSNPDMSKEEARNKYLEGGGEQAPGVGPFTSAVADYGVANLFDLIRPFRKLPTNVRRDMYTVDFVKMDIRSKQHKNDLDCPYCQKKEYLYLNEKYRLNRPALGRPNVAL